MLDKDRSEVSEGAEVNAYLGKGSRVSGKLNFDGTVRVDGHVEGEISAQDTLIVGESAVVTAQINGNTVIIRGKVTGDINARKRVEIRAPGKLYGNIVTPSLVIHEGVVFEGHCSMGSSDSRSAERKVTPFPKEEKGGDGTLAKVPSEATK
ncbi:MAG: bactofilin family protein [Candidatus Binatia bacterium]